MKIILKNKNLPHSGAFHVCCVYELNKSNDTNTHTREKFKSIFDSRIIFIPQNNHTRQVFQLSWEESFDSNGNNGNQKSYHIFCQQTGKVKWSRDESIIESSSTSRHWMALEIARPIVSRCQCISVCVRTFSYWRYSTDWTVDETSIQNQKFPFHLHPIHINSVYLKSIKRKIQSGSFKMWSPNPQKKTRERECNFCTMYKNMSYWKTKQ